MTTTNRTRPTRFAITACGSCWVCRAPSVVTCGDASVELDRIDRDANEAAAFDRKEYGVADPVTHLLDGFVMRDWRSEREARTCPCRMPRHCAWEFKRDPENFVACEECFDTVARMRCAWARFQTTYEAAFAAKG